MIGRHSATELGTGRNRGIWPVLALILAAVLVPTACVLWFMSAAMRNERLAVRETLTQAYASRVIEAQQQLDAFWDRRAGEISLRPGEGPGEAFARLARSRLADSFIVLDERGYMAYPNAAAVIPPVATTASAPACVPAAAPATMPATAPAIMPATAPGAESESLWAEAEQAEFASASPDKAAEVYARIVAAGGDDQAVARALIAQARCLVKADKRKQAAAILTESLEQPRFRRALDAQGRLIIASGRLMALELMDRKDPRFAPAAKRLVDQVNDYRDLSMPAGQRMFLMTRLAELVPDARWPTLQAELSCQEMSQGLSDFKAPPKTKRLGSWYNGPMSPATTIEYLRAALPSSDLRAYGLFRGRRVIDEAEGLLNRGPAAMEASYRIINSVVARPELGTPFLIKGASRKHMTDWRVGVYLNGPDPFTAAADQRNAVYLWTGILGIAFIAVLAVALASYLGRQMRLTRLKNDLIATVSHELKTPLASMRVLVDTLREGRCADAKQAGEYFDLIAKENERLSRLIDNFLTFSRMERNKRAFEFESVDVAGAVRAAVAAVGERFSCPDARLDVDLPADLPRIRADRDALVTVLLNLLDNAWKYSGDGKVVKVRAYAAGPSVCIEVADNGVGMSRRAMSRIFDKFYQVDQTLSRKAGGCGLGLSIVKFILDAHGGSIDVKSQVRQGSMFTVHLPAETKERRLNAEVAENAEKKTRETKAGGGLEGLRD
jgi:signal transduction histidine kinase